MATLSDLTAAVTGRIQNAQRAGGSLVEAAAAAVVREDVHDLQTEINKSIGKIGMMILVGMPHFTNEARLQNPNLEAKILFAVAVAEDPILWRKNNPDNKPRPFAPAVAQIVAQLLQNFLIPSFNYLRVLRVDYVPDPKRQLYEIAVETLLVAPALQN